MLTTVSPGQVRPATAEDRVAAVEVWRATQAAKGLRPPAARVARVQEKVATGMLAVLGEPVIAMALGEGGIVEGATVPTLLHLSMVYVHPAHQGRGVGAALVEGLADLAWARGYRTMSAWADDPGFLLACGFELTGDVAGDAVRLSAELEAPVREVVVASDGIRLGQLLKLAEVVETGAEGKALLAAGEVEVNGEVEERRGRQLVDGDEIRARDQAVRVVIGTTP